MNDRRNVTLVLVAALAATGCGGDRLASHEARGRCTGRAAPLTGAIVVPVLRRHGFSVTSSTTDPSCQSMDASIRGREALGFSVTNTDAAAKAPEGEGTLYCDLSEGAVWGRKLTFDGDAEPSSPIFNGDKAEAKLANLDCTLYPHSRLDVWKLRRAMRELAARVARGSG